MLRARAAAPMQLQWKRPGTGEPRDPAWEVGVQPPAGRRLWKERREPSGAQVAAAEWWTSLYQQMPGGDGERREGGSSRECIPPPCTPARGTALKSCGVCHRPASTRMRIGQVEFFFFPLPSLFSAAFGSAT